MDTRKVAASDRNRILMIDHYPIHEDLGLEVVEAARSAATAATAAAQHKALRKAAVALYLEGRWELTGPDAPPSAVQAALWDALRDALGFKPGFSL